MSEVDQLIKDIEELRENLIKIALVKENNFLDPEVVAASQILNGAIVKYNELLLRKIGTK